MLAAMGTRGDAVSVTILIVFTAAMLSSIGGFAFAALCAAPLFHFMPPVTVVTLIIVCSIAMQIMSVIVLRNAIDWRTLFRFLPGAVLSLPLGIFLLLCVEAGIYSRILGMFLVAYGGFMLLRPHTTMRFQPAWADYLVGSLGGITGGFAGFPSAFLTLWCALKGWSKDRQRGVYQPYILIMQILTLALLSCVSAGRDPLGTAAIWHVLIYVPAALLGTWCGLGWYSRLSDGQFRAAVNLLLIGSGAALLF
jgi:uncharacterized membrane protein YfcA